MKEILRGTRIHGFAGGSVFERLPIRDIVTSTVQRFKNIAIDTVRRGDIPSLPAMIGQSRAMQEVFDLVHSVAPYDVNVCIEGETGTGKELVASALHRGSSRAGYSLIRLNCGAIPEGLLESEFFGHEKGAFTGAECRRLGKFEMANRGTLFLDEIADLSPRGQVAILRAIEQREIIRVGGDRTIPIDVRFVAASNQPLREAVEQRRFREDLYYRLNYITVKLPPLRHRADDIPALVEAIVARLRVELNRDISGVSPGFLAKLLDHHWPGNIRELEHVIGEAAVREPGRILEGRHFEPMDHTDPRGPSTDTAFGKRQAIAERAVFEAGGNKSRAAEALGITRKTLYAWLRKG